MAKAEPQPRKPCKRCSSGASRKGPSLFCGPCRVALEKAGTCLRCGEHPLDRKRYCTKCMAADLEKRQAALEVERKANPTSRLCRGCKKQAYWSSCSYYCTDCRSEVKEAGTCPRCGVNPLPEGRRYCSGCQQEDTRLALEKQHANQAAGLCRCGAELSNDGLKGCLECRSKFSSNLAVFRAGRKAAGICESCLVRPSSEDTQRCLECAISTQLRYKHIRLQVLEGYGGKCVCCGDNWERFLEIDHVVRTWVGKRPPSESSFTLIRRLLAEGFPEGYRILCVNCNWCARLTGSCPLPHGAQASPTWEEVLKNAPKDKVRRLQNKVEAMSAYGSACECCGENDLAAMTIDHINGGGSAEYRALGGGSDTMYIDLRRRNWPSGYQVLCFGCNRAKYWSKVCPHQGSAIGVTVAAALNKVRLEIALRAKR